MGVIEEAFISGFCRTSNETRTVAYGALTLTEFDCNYEKCPNSSACLICKEAFARASESRGDCAQETEHGNRK